MDYQIAIPSYKRPNYVVSQTLQTLKNLGSDFSNVTVFVANKEEKLIYDTAIEGVGLKVETVVGVPGLLKQRIWYNTEHYSEGTRILNMDDDVAGLFQKDGEKKFKPLEMPIDEFAMKGFDLCEEYGARLWGINAVLNGFFMKDTVTVGLRYICGIFHGTYAGDPTLCGPDRFMESSGEDFENTLAHYKAYGKVLRFDGIAPKTKYFAQGGMQAELGGNKEKRNDDHTAKLKAIAERYPDLCKLVEKAGGIHNIRCKTLTEAKIDFEP